MSKNALLRAYIFLFLRFLYLSLIQRWINCLQFLAHSKNELMQWRGIRRLSVHPSVCRLLRKSLLLAHKWPDCHQTFTRWTPSQPASRECSRSRSRVTWYGHFCAGTKIASSPRQMAGSRPNLHTMVTRVCSRSRSRSKVTWCGHFCAGTKIASSPRQMAGSQPNLHTMVSR